jgi:hypothetical protein
VFSHKWRPIPNDKPCLDRLCATSTDYTSRVRKKERRPDYTMSRCITRCWIRPGATNFADQNISNFQAGIVEPNHFHELQHVRRAKLILGIDGLIWGNFFLFLPRAEETMKSGNWFGDLSDREYIYAHDGGGRPTPIRLLSESTWPAWRLPCGLAWLVNLSRLTRLTMSALVSVTPRWQCTWWNTRITNAEFSNEFGIPWWPVTTARTDKKVSWRN